MCKYKKTCPNYDELSHTCNFAPDEDIKCGKYRELEEKNKKFYKD